jgi:hypothetical protein
VAAGACASGEICTGVDATGARFDGTGFFAAAAGPGDCRGGWIEAFAAAGGERGNGGSGDLMLTAGVEAALGKSALVGLPVGTDGPSPATGAATGAAATGGGSFHDGA